MIAVDYKGREIALDQKVIYGAPNTPTEVENQTATVVSIAEDIEEIEEWPGALRSEPICLVTVRFADGTEEVCSGHYDRTQSDEHMDVAYEINDLEVPT